MTEEEFVAKYGAEDADGFPRFGDEHSFGHSVFELSPVDTIRVDGFGSFLSDVNTYVESFWKDAVDSLLD